MRIWFSRYLAVGLLMISLIRLIGAVDEPQLCLPLLFSDGMVLQRGQDVRVWGWTSPGEDVCVEIDTTVVQTQSNSDGRFEVLLPAHCAGMGYELRVVSGDSKKRFVDVCFGDVWLASGQSNMEWKLGMGTHHWEEEVAGANYPEIRFFDVPKEYSQQPLDKISGRPVWREASPMTVGDFSAVAWYFAKRNHLAKDVPVGVISSAWGGTPAEAWTPASSVQSLPFYEEKAAHALNDSIDWEGAIENNKRADEQKWELITNEAAAFSIGAQRVEYDDSNWQVVELPNQEPLSDVVWLRSEFSLKEIPGEVTIMLGSVSEEASVFVNGQWIGKKRSDGKTVPMPVPASALQRGRNMIAIRAINSWNNEVEIGKAGAFYLCVDGRIEELPTQWKYSNEVEAKIPEVEHMHWNPGFLYNGMIHPVEGYTIAGVIWYQGESNTGESSQYEDLFRMMIQSWRVGWRQGNFPFLFVQLANFMKRVDDPKPSAWAELREAQRQTLRLPATGMAVTIDIGEAEDVHPRNKDEVGERLWLAAEKVVFGEAILFSGPILETFTMVEGGVELEFSQVGRQLITSDGAKDVVGFSVEDCGGHWEWAGATIIRDDTVFVAFDCERISSVRYAWADNPACNFYNFNGLPASPFALKLK